MGQESGNSGGHVVIYIHKTGTNAHLYIHGAHTRESVVWVA